MKQQQASVLVMVQDWLQCVANLRSSPRAQSKRVTPSTDVPQSSLLSLFTPRVVRVAGCQYILGGY